MIVSHGEWEQSLAAFQAKAEAWQRYTQSPLGRLREELTLQYLSQHLPRNRLLRILDAGAGSGSYALPLAAKGHRVVLVDFSSAMLDVARQKAMQGPDSLLERLDFCCMPIDQACQHQPAADFDVVICHTVLEYLPAPESTLLGLAGLLRPQGLLSLLVANPASEVLRCAFTRHDPVAALQALQGGLSTADLFGLPRQSVPKDAWENTLARGGVRAIAEYGIRIFADYLPADKLADQGFLEVRALELAAGPLEPYRHIGRYRHWIGYKDAASAGG